ncbi:CTP synthetase [Dinoroseobacter sp. PD6]|uniref:CTP synthetase n=1 Tax=Dinoroseobacter sp. PD6 TaxID=3028384 RepID=UPI00237AEE56|nr:CTP synthetase [Dinoroseobacter sp. PD6]MDD9718479.1 CTP synthetase [Dinoroseobacter sp. PD6]
MRRLTWIKARNAAPQYIRAMHRLPLTVFSLIAPTLAGVGVVIGLVGGLTSGMGLVLSAGAGAVVALPVSWAVARALSGPPKTGEDP